MAVSTWLSAAAKNSKSDDPNGHRFCDKKSVTQKVSKPMYSTASFLFSVRFVSDAALLRSLFCLVCRSSDSSIQAARLIAACDLAPYCQRIASAFSPGHDSPSNDRFSPHAGIPRMENNALEIQLLWEVCRRVLRGSRAVRIRCLRIQRADFFPCPGFSPDSLVQLEQECVSVRHCRRCLRRVCVRSGRAFATKACN